MWRGRVFNWGCQAEGRVCWAPRDLLISLHSNSLKNKLCRFQFFVFFSRVLVEMWTCRDFCSPPSLATPLPRVTSKRRSDQRQLKKNKIPQRTGTLHTYIQLLPVSTPRSLSHSENKSERWRLMFPFLFLSSPPRAQSCQTLQHFNWFPFFPPLVCVCSILVRKPRDWISH